MCPSALGYCTLAMNCFRFGVIHLDILLGAEEFAPLPSVNSMADVN